MEYYRRLYPHAKRYILDSSGDGMPEVYAAHRHTGDSIPPTLLSPAYTLIWEPETDQLELYNAWLLRILQAREPAIVLVDEIASLTGYTSAGVLEGHFKLLKQGRKHGITVINCTQEMTRVPLVMFRQMSYFVQFRLNRDPYELARARAYLDMTREEHKAPSTQYGFFMRHTGGNFPVKEYRSYHDLFGQFFRMGEYKHG
jgi:hypothetical protein